MTQKFFITFSIALFLFAKQVNAQEKVLVDNAKIKVTEYISQPGQDVCGPGKHTHKEHLTILLTDAKVKMTRNDGTIEDEAFSKDRHQLTVTTNGKSDQITTDGTFWAEGTTHTVINTGKQPIKLLIVETKQ